MPTSVTIQLRTLTTVALLAVALVAAYLWGSTEPDRAARANQPVGSAQLVAEGGTAEAPVIVMTGVGEIEGVPDQLAFGVTVTITDTDVSSALSQANATMRSVLQALQGEGVARKDTQTTGLSVRPQYSYSGDGPPVLVGYRATEQLAVVVGSLPEAGRALSAVADAGGNDVRIHGVRLQFADTDALLEQARADAVEQATAKAQQYTQAAGMSLGSVIDIREVSRVGSPVDYPREVASYVAGRVPIRAGTSEVNVTVSITWSLG